MIGQQRDQVRGRSALTQAPPSCWLALEEWILECMLMRRGGRSA